MADRKVHMSEDEYRGLHEHLFQGESEQVAFLFAGLEESDDSVDMPVRQIYCLSPEEFEIHSVYHIELTDEAWAKVIKMAWDLGAVPIEVHSHRDARFPVGFSPTDFAGFKEIVPHVRWRLRGQPYVALVFSPTGFDGLVWNGEELTVETVDALVVGEREIYASGRSIRKAERYL